MRYRMGHSTVWNDRQAREARIALREVQAALSSESALKAIVAGLPEEAINGIWRSLSAEEEALQRALRAYEATGFGNFDELREQAGDDPGALLVFARVVQGLSQKELARRLGLKEQAIQRYEAERYRGISLSNAQKIAAALGVQLRLDLSGPGDTRGSDFYNVSATDLRKVVSHAKKRKWIERPESSDEDIIGHIRKRVADHLVRYPKPSLLRTGMKVVDKSSDWLLLSWKAQVTKSAEEAISRRDYSYRPLSLLWLKDLVRLSTKSDGPILARDLLAEHGIVLVVEPQIAGMGIDGASFLVDDTPVIGLTILRDTIDSFWFTLLHELGHVILHYRKGLGAGFFDDLKQPDVISELEGEANGFASNMLIPSEVWRRSPARISRYPQPIEALAGQLGIAPAIIFGRIRMERNDYSLFSDRIGQGKVGKLFGIKDDDQ